MSSDIAVAELDAQGARERLDALSEILFDCVEGGASVSFMWPFGEEQARLYWAGVIAALMENHLRLYVAVVKGRIGGTVQLWLDSPCNQRHRGDIRKMLVHRSFRRLGVAKSLMSHAEAQARLLGLSLLTLDTVTGSPAEQLYDSLAWRRAGVIPQYAKWPDGRFCDATIFFKDLS
jgi:GNAT superfamily N-acetyltransferase